MTCVVNCWYWGSKAEICLDVLVLGSSLKTQCVRAEAVASVHEDQIGHPFCELLKTFWRVQSYTSLELPPHLKDSEMQRLVGVWDKLKAWWTIEPMNRDVKKQERVVVLDGDMLVNSSLSELWSFAVPGAVDRGERDQSALNPRPIESYFGAHGTHGRSGKMVGGKNGGLMLCDPNARDYKTFYEQKLLAWKPTDNMAEQAFLSHVHAAEDNWHSIPKKFNVQVHHAMLTSGRQKSGGQKKCINEFQQLLEDMRKAAIVHYSAHRKPSNMVTEEVWSGRPWRTVRDMVKQQFDEMVREHRYRMKQHVLNDPDEMAFLRNASDTAHYMWLEEYERCWLSLLTDIWVTAGGKWKAINSEVKAEKRATSWVCPLCGQCVVVSTRTSEANAVDYQEMRDHVFVNCMKIRAEVTFSIGDIFDLSTLFSHPHGSLVAKQMMFLGQISRIWKGAPVRRVMRPCADLDVSAPPRLAAALVREPVSDAPPPWLSSVTTELDVEYVGAAMAQPPQSGIQMVRKFKVKLKKIKDTLDFATTPDFGWLTYDTTFLGRLEEAARLGSMLQSLPRGELAKPVDQEAADSAEEEAEEKMTTRPTKAQMDTRTKTENASASSGLQSNSKPRVLQPTSKAMVLKRQGSTASSEHAKRLKTQVR